MIDARKAYEAVLGGAAPAELKKQLEQRWPDLNYGSGCYEQKTNLTKDGRGMKKTIELLAPAGDLARLKTAVRYGADAVYLGGKRFSLRSRASNFELDDIAEGVRFAREYGAHVHVTVNIIPHEDDFDGLDDYLRQLESIGRACRDRRFTDDCPPGENGRAEAGGSSQHADVQHQFPSCSVLPAAGRGPGCAGPRMHDGSDPADLRAQ